MTGIYIHIPFCERKCLYCDFNSYANAYELEDAYVDALIYEIEHYKGTRADTLYIGGGTPSSLKEESLRRILTACKKSFRFAEDAEITAEVNPASAIGSKLSVLKDCGVNRLSIGVQSFHDNELNALGRLHNTTDAILTYENARKLGFSNINLDIMLATPYQTTASLEESLQAIIALKPEHISAYSLIVEPGTSFATSVSNLPEEEEERKMYWLTNDRLGSAGYHRYEISNFALPDKESRHNLKYWNGEDYIGLGAGASSYMHAVRSSRLESIKDYIQNPFQAKELTCISPDERKREYFWLGLRQTDGVIDTGDFSEIVAKLISEDLLEKAGNRIRLTQRGTDLANQVFMEFI